MHSLFFLVRNTVWVTSGLLLVTLTILLIALCNTDTVMGR